MPSWDQEKTRSLGCYRQAMFGLVVPGQGIISRLGTGFGLSQATAYRYIDEVIGVLGRKGARTARGA